MIEKKEEKKRAFKAMEIINKCERECLSSVCLTEDNQKRVNVK